MSPIQHRRSAIDPEARAEFDLREFERTLDEHGYDATWEKAIPCPNRDALQEDHHTINCTYCDQSGHIYYDLVTLKLHVTSFATRQVIMTEGRYEPGTAYFTAKPAHKLSFWDRITLTTAIARYSEVKKRQVDNVYELRYPVVHLDHIQTNQNVSIDVNSATINSEGNLVLPAWTGNFVAVSYLYHPVYVVLDLLHQIRDSRVTQVRTSNELEFPMQVMGRLDFLVRDESVMPR